MKTMEQLGDDLCQYCEPTDYGERKAYTTRNGDYISCEGDFCEKAYKKYLEDNNLENELILEEN